MSGQSIQTLLTITGARTVLGLEIVDQTGLTGRFDIDLDYVGQSTSTGPALVTAFREQLGLKFEKREEVLDVVVIDHVEPPTPD
jgi:uncharacterized protein (TIGR03435 family)